MSTMTFKGRGAKTGVLPHGLDHAKQYFQDLPAFLAKIEDVDTVKPLQAAGAYLVTHKPMGGLNYFVVMVAVLKATWDGSQMTLESLDFDLDKIKSEHQVVKGFLKGGLKLDERSPGQTDIDFAFDLDVEFPVPGVLRLVPSSLVQSTGDGIMTLKIGATVQSLYKKVLTDFNLPEG